MAETETAFGVAPIRSPVLSMKAQAATIEAAMPAFRSALLVLGLLAAPSPLPAQTSVPRTDPRTTQATPTQATHGGVAPTPLPPDVLPDEAPASIRIFNPPPIRWDHAMGTPSPALHQGRSDFSNLTGGITFGMQASDVNALLPVNYPAMDWGIMPQAVEFPTDVRYFWVRFESAGDLRMGTTHCAGAGSYLVFLFTGNGLFRLSYRLVPDHDCPAVEETARDVFARYVTMDPLIAQSLRYRTGNAEVVDVTDPAAGFLSATRWYQVGR